MLISHLEYFLRLDSTYRHAWISGRKACLQMPKVEWRIQDACRQQRLREAGNTGNTAQLSFACTIATHEV